MNMHDSFINIADAHALIWMLREHGNTEITNIDSLSAHKLLSNLNSGLLALEATGASWGEVYANATRGDEHPDLIMCGLNQYQSYCKSLMSAGTKPVQANTALIRAGFENVTFKNTPVVLDMNVDPDTAYFLNTKHLHLNSSGNLTCSNRALQGIYKGEQ